MHEIKNLKEKLCRELDEYASRGKMDLNTLQIIDTIAHTVKNLNKIMEQEEETGYNEGPRIHGNYSFAGSNGSGNSGSGYSSAGNYNNRYNYNRNMGDWRMNDYSTAGRYATGNDVMIQQLYDLMNDARDEKTRREFQKFIDRMERM